MTKKLLIYALSGVGVAIVLAGLIWFLFLTDSDEIISFDPLEPLEPFNIPVIRGDKVTKMVMVRLALMHIDADRKQETRSSMPKLMDAYLVELYDYFSYVQLDQPLSGREIKARLRSATLRILGEDKVQDIIFEGAFERRRRQ